MTSLDLPTTGSADVRAMAGIEARRLARHPAFVVGVVLAFGGLGLMFGLNDNPAVTDLLSGLVIGAFFIGLSSLVATARLTRSTESAEEAVGTAPGSQARRTTALALACLVPFAAGVAWSVVYLALIAQQDTTPQEWWFATMPDWQVWCLIVGLGPVSCLGGALLGVLTGRWLHFPGATAVVIVGLAAFEMVLQGVAGEGPHSWVRLFVPWASFHTGTDPDGTATLLAGQPGVLPRLPALPVRRRLAGRRLARHLRPDAPAAQRDHRASSVVGLCSLGLAMTTGPEQPDVRPDPVEGRRLMRDRTVVVPQEGGPVGRPPRVLRGRRRDRRRDRPVAVDHRGPAPRRARLLRGRRGVRLRRGRGPGHRRHAPRPLAAGRPLRLRRSCRCRVGGDRAGSDPATCPAARRRGGWSAPPCVLAAVGTAGVASRLDQPAPGSVVAALVALAVFAPWSVGALLGLVVALPGRGTDHRGPDLLALRRRRPGWPRAWRRCARPDPRPQRQLARGPARAPRRARPPAPGWSRRAWPGSG